MYKILSANIEPSTFGMHTTWDVWVNGKEYYISHQSNLLGEYPEAMAFGYDIWGRIDWPHELAVNHIENPDKAFVDIIQQLEAL